MGKFVINHKNSKYHFALKAGNGETILSSEAYESHTAVKSGVESVRKNSANEKAFEVREAKNGQTYFVLKATNGQIIGQSEMYASPSGCKNGIESVQKNAPDAEVVEE